MRVLHVLNELKPSGAEVMLHTARDLWRSHNVDADVLSVGHRVGEYAEVLSNDGYEVHHIPRSSSIHFVCNFLLLIRKYDVIHIHTEHWNFLYGMLARIMMKRCVRTIHNNFNFIGITRLKLLVQRAILSAISVRHVAISSGVASTEVSRYMNYCQIVGNWYDVSKFSNKQSTESKALARQKLGISTDAKVIAVVGNCSDIKNHQSLFKAVAKLKGSLDVTVLHAGMEDSAHTERELTKELGIESQVRFLGKVPDVGVVLHAADLYAMPSLHEGFSIAALEALATGVPMLLTDVPGLKDLADEFDGIIYCRESASSIADGILYSFGNMKKFEVSVGGNNSKVAEKYSPMRGVSGYVAIYRGT
jgi:glycosyltransferase involved in cell wall biosynthesis